MNIIQTIYEKLKKYNIVQSYYFYRDYINNNNYNFNLVISLCENIEAPSYESLNIAFYGITNFKINDLDNMYRIMINIEDVSSYQNEFVKYKIKEIEYDMFSFGCVKIDICDKY